jgi:hypothetical protein
MYNIPDISTFDWVRNPIYSQGTDCDSTFSNSPPTEFNNITCGVYDNGTAPWFF